MKTTDVVLFITNKANNAILLERIDDKNTNSPISRLPELHDVPDERSQIEDFIKDTMKKDTGIEVTVNVISNKTTRNGSDTNKSIRFAMCTAEMNNARIWKK